MGISTVGTGRSGIAHRAAMVVVAALGVTAVAVPASAECTGAAWAEIELEGGETAELSTTYSTSNDSQFPTDLEVGESVTRVRDGAETTFVAVTASCTISTTLRTPYVASGYAMASYKFSSSSGCGTAKADVQLLRQQLGGLGGWKVEASKSHAMRANLTVSGVVRKKCRNNSLQVKWRAISYWNGGVLDDRTATLACRL